MGKALARGATKAATVAAACSGHKRITNGDLATDYSDSKAGMGARTHSNESHGKRTVEELFTRLGRAGI